MGTHAYIGFEKADHTIEASYVHWDGYPQHIAPLLLNFYNATEKVQELVALGGLSTLHEKVAPDPDKPHSFEAPQENVTVAYHRDRQEPWEINKPNLYTSRKDFLDASKTAFFYLWSNNQWLLYVGQDFVELTESGSAQRKAPLKAKVIPFRKPTLQ